ncbi:hypothetical protein [Williamsoniiplasma lucivorax]|uniref:Uncharacterized protein n=1 Tax=Williamsoniiplasma lucivorax TaxID=209274 RepID=A0A2S5REZ1_9MOLU|nr:hypothetical protein [Williamsoniiplasma lucivorax]PPE05782.1 hypothetical protein ELUCI_v1c00700 [Williamsoniiplasma lucivorax]
MRQLTQQELKSTDGGRISGSFLSGIAAIFNAVVSFVGTVINSIVTFGHNDADKGMVKSKDASMTWDNTKHPEPAAHHPAPAVHPAPVVHPAPAAIYIPEVTPHHEDLPMVDHLHDFC